MQTLNWSSSALIESSVSLESDNYGVWQLKPTPHQLLEILSTQNNKRVGFFFYQLAADGWLAANQECGVWLSSKSVQKK